MTKRRSVISALIDAVGNYVSHPIFFIILLLSHLLWISLNIPAISPTLSWDPYPFTLLATIASVEGPLLSVMILLRQRRDNRISELRQEFILQLNLQIGNQTAYSCRLLDRLRQSMNIDPLLSTNEFEEMAAQLDEDSLLDWLRRQLQKTEGSEE